MTNRLDLKEILEKHPNIDAAQLQKTIDLFEELRRRGIGQQSKLCAPFGRRRARLVDDLENDPRTLRLRSR